jgi:hypothetical protein
MPDTALGQCDMVLAVAEDTINYQFSNLLHRGLIRPTWKVLVRSPKGGTPVVKTQEDADFDSVLQTWRTTQAELAADFAAGRYADYAAKLQAAQAAGQLWDYGWTGTIAAPAVTILQGDTQDILFTIAFTAGTLLSCPNPTVDVETWDLTSAKYAFRVPIGRLTINGTQEILTPEAQGQAAVVIRDSGLTDADFSIESLFLDFENANIANFDAPASKFPAGADTAIQVTAQDYFKLVVAGSANPFVLGYTLKVQGVHPTALFQPTATRFSTSYSAQPGCSAFNFLMMTGGRDFPGGQQVGVLPASLLEGAALTAGQDGVFAIDWTVFNGLLLDSFPQAIAPAITAGINPATFARSAQTWSLTVGASDRSVVSEPSSDLFYDTHLYSERSVNASLALTNADGGLALTCTASFTAQIRVMCWETLHAGYHTEFYASLSTGGTYSVGPTGGLGQVGRAGLTIQPGAQGAVVFAVGPVTPPVLGYDSAPDTGSKVSGDPNWTVVQADSSYAGAQDLAQGAMAAAAGLNGTMTGVATAMQSTIQSLSAGKVVLPLGQLYTFKQIRLRDTSQTDANSVLMDVSYAPVGS